MANSSFVLRLVKVAFLLDTFVYVCIVKFYLKIRLSLAKSYKVFFDEQKVVGIKGFSVSFLTSSVTKSNALNPSSCHLTTTRYHLPYGSATVLAAQGGAASLVTTI